MNAKRTRVFLEIANIEKTYVTDLKCIVNDFKQPMVNEHILTDAEAGKIFINTETILRIHVSINERLQNLRGTWSFKSCIYSCFLEEGSELAAYRTYIPQVDQGMGLLQSLRERNSDLRKYLTSMEGSPKMRNMELQDMLIQPVQRVPRYILLLKEYLKFTPPNHPDYTHLPKLIQHLDEIMKEINVHKRISLNLSKVKLLQDEVSGANLSGLTEYEMEGELLRLSKKGEIKKVYVFLFDEMFIMAKHSTPEQSDTPILSSISDRLAKMMHAKTYKFKLRKSIKMSKIVEARAAEGKTFILVVSKNVMKKGHASTVDQTKNCKLYKFEATSEKVQLTWINIISKLVKQYHGKLPRSHTW